MAPGESLRTLLKTVMVAHGVVSPERSKYIQAEQFSLGSHLLPRRCSSHLQHSGCVCHLLHFTIEILVNECKKCSYINNFEQMRTFFT